MAEECRAARSRVAGAQHNYDEARAIEERAAAQALAAILSGDPDRADAAAAQYRHAHRLLQAAAGALDALAKGAGLLGKVSALLLALYTLACAGPAAAYRLIDDPAERARCASLCPGAASVTVAELPAGGEWCYCGCDDGREVHAFLAFDLAESDDGGPADKLSRALWRSYCPVRP